MLERLFPAAVDRAATTAGYAAGTVAIVLYGPELIAIGLVNPAATTEVISVATGAVVGTITNSSGPIDPVSTPAGGYASILNTIYSIYSNVFGGGR